MLTKPNFLRIDQFDRLIDRSICNINKISIDICIQMEFNEILDNNNRFLANQTFQGYEMPKLKFVFGQIIICKQRFTMVNKIDLNLDKIPKN
ncbi:hypothetical protein DERP_008335 [Dermatophagoides pteronyssinus]|uniref:Uncharacterized protein n=1 Tax=Dermatophagoides pteronyssinus TaxID=6956 RepID=A0ABQ8J690_DERPT|nr:hypothetical protein DERP_008335 [Dermatophagoides pteronyssinus]